VTIDIPATAAYMDIYYMQNRVVTSVLKALIAPTVTI